MKKAAICALALLLLAAVTVPATAQGTPEDAKLKKFQDNYIDVYFKFFPTAGSRAGYAKYTDRLEDLSTGSIERFHDGLDALNQELVTKIDRTKLSPEGQADYELLFNAVDLEFVRFEQLIPWDYNPLFYNGLFLDSVRALLTSGAGPLDLRVKGAAARARLLPGLIKQAQSNLKTPPQIYTEAALQQLPAIVDFYQNQVGPLVESSAAKAALLAETPKVAAALGDYQKWMQADLLPKSTGNYRIGEAHPRMLRDRTMGTLAINEDLIPRSQADVTNIRRAMGAVCIPLFAIMFPSQDINQITQQKGVEATLNYVVQSVLDKIKPDHATKENFLPAITAAVDRIKGYMSQSQFLTPPAENLAVAPMPPALQGTSWFLLAGPGAFETAAANYTQYVQPIPDSWTPEQATQFLEEHNNFDMDFWVIQRVYPGRFWPTAVTRSVATNIGKLFPNEAVINGWAPLLEEPMIFAGYQNYDLRMRLGQLKQLLKTAIAFQVDINVHQGNQPQEQLTTYMVQRGFMAPIEAERLFRDVALNPGNAAITYIGYQELLDIQKEYKKLRGDQYADKDFFQRVLSFGPLPLRMIRERISK